MSLTKENSNYASGDTKERANSDLSESDRSTPPRDPNSTFQAYRLTIDEVAQEFNTSIVDGLEHTTLKIEYKHMAQTIWVKVTKYPTPKFLLIKFSMP